MKGCAIRAKPRPNAREVLGSHYVQKSLSRCLRSQMNSLDSRARRTIAFASFLGRDNSHGKLKDCFRRLVTLAWQWADLGHALSRSSKARRQKQPKRLRRLEHFVTWASSSTMADVRYFGSVPSTSEGGVRLAGVYVAEHARETSNQ